MDEPLAGEVTIQRWRRECHLVVEPRLVHGRARDLDDLQSGGALQDAVADARRLEHTVTRREHERWTLVLVDEPHPSGHAEDQLEANGVVMNLVGHRAGVEDADVGGDEPASLTCRQQVAIEHPRPPRSPARFGHPTELQRRLQWRDDEPRRCSGRGRVTATGQSYRDPAPFEHGEARVVGGHHHVHDEATITKAVEHRFELVAFDRGVDVEHHRAATPSTWAATRRRWKVVSPEARISAHVFFMNSCRSASHV